LSNYLVDRTAKAAGFACGFALADKGVDLRTIQEWLGRRSIEMPCDIPEFRSGDLVGCGARQPCNWNGRLHPADHRRNARNAHKAQAKPATIPGQMGGWEASCRDCLPP